MTEPIPTPRLDLVSLAPDFLDAALEGDARAASRILGARVPDGWPDLADTRRVALERLRAGPSFAPWSLRALVLREGARMVGHVGFHAPPTPDGVELTWTVFDPDRRRGYAREACRALIAWAHAAHGVERFVATIAPENAPSLALARALGFRRVVDRRFELRTSRNPSRLGLPGWP